MAQTVCTCNNGEKAGWRDCMAFEEHCLSCHDGFTLDGKLCTVTPSEGWTTLGTGVCTFDNGDIAAANMQYESTYNYPGTIEDCKEACIAQGECKAVEYKPERCVYIYGSGQPITKSQNGGEGFVCLKYDDSGDSGAEVCYTEHQDKVWTVKNFSTDLADKGVIDTDACKQACDSDSGCYAYLTESSSGACQHYLVDLADLTESSNVGITVYIKSACEPKEWTYVGNGACEDGEGSDIWNNDVFSNTYSGANYDGSHDDCKALCLQLPNIKGVMVALLQGGTLNRCICLGDFTKDDQTDLMKQEQWNYYSGTNTAEIEGFIANEKYHCYKWEAVPNANAASSHGDPIIWTFKGECYDLNKDGLYLASSHPEFSHDVYVAVYNEFIREIQIQDEDNTILLSISNLNELSGEWNYGFKQRDRICRTMSWKECEFSHPQYAFDTQVLRYTVQIMHHDYLDPALKH